jgi:hypothetical protein
VRHPETWPAQLHPLIPVVDSDVLVPDLDRTVEAFQLRADLVSDLVLWSAGQLDISRGTPAVVLPDGGGRVELGDYVVRPVGARRGQRAEPAAGFWQRFRPVVDVADAAGH